MRNQLQKLLLLFAVAIFILLVSFSFILYFSTKNSIDYQQKLLSQSIMNKEVREHIENKNGVITIQVNDEPDKNELPTLYFITDGKKLLKQSDYGHNLIDYIHSHTEHKEYLHHYISYDDRHYYVSSKKIVNNFYIYTVLDSTESYHALEKLKHMLVGISMLYLFLIIALAYYLSKLAVKPYKEAVMKQKIFVQNASHELKTPITVVKTGLSVLTTYEKERLSIIGQETIQDLNDEVEHMKHMVNQLLLLDTVQHSEMTMVNIKEICENVASKYNKQLNHPAKLHLVDTFVNGNKDALAQALSILFDNAIKYNDQSVRITIHLSHKTLTFKDNGKGIRDEDIQYLFERFYRGTEVGNIEGTGIGLALFKEIIDAHDARVEVMNDSGLKFNIFFKN